MSDLSHSTTICCCNYFTFHFGPPNTKKKEKKKRKAKFILTAQHSHEPDKMYMCLASSRTCVIPIDANKLNQRINDAVCRMFAVGHRQQCAQFSSPACLHTYTNKHTHTPSTQNWYSRTRFSAYFVSHQIRALSM